MTYLLYIIYIRLCKNKSLHYAGSVIFKLGQETKFGRWKISSVPAMEDFSVSGAQAQRLTVQTTPNTLLPGRQPWQPDSPVRFSYLVSLFLLNYRLEHVLHSS